ncbi:MAG: ABC transporter ATP-binding protein [Betaproteobacteria bacterium]|nr:ABC transporter ATP-binding protein [Betaproteobacteria bacterium]
MTAAVIVENLVKRFGDVRAVNDISFTVAAGSTTALLGGNGAGKTTTISMLLGVLLPTTGRINVLGADMLQHRYRVLPRMNFTSPYVDLPKKLTVVENLMVFAGLYGVVQPRKRIATLVEELEIGNFAGRAYGTLSAGQRTRVSVAKALLNTPDLILLDEPTASLDPDMGDRVRHSLMQYQQRTGATLVIASHNMAEVERMCDSVLMMKGGKIVHQGSPDELIERFGRDSMEEVFLDIARAVHPGQAPSHATERAAKP